MRHLLLCHHDFLNITIESFYDFDVKIQDAVKKMMANDYQGWVEQYGPDSWIVKHPEIDDTIYYIIVLLTQPSDIGILDAADAYLYCSPSSDISTFEIK